MKYLSSRAATAAGTASVGCWRVHEVVDTVETQGGTAHCAGPVFLANIDNRHSVPTRHCTSVL